MPVLDAGAHGATLSFTHRGIGDVLLAWENEGRIFRSAHLSIKETDGGLEIAAPSAAPGGTPFDAAGRNPIPLSAPKPPLATLPGRQQAW